MFDSLAEDVILLETLDSLIQRVNLCFNTVLNKQNLKHFLLSKGITIVSFDKQNLIQFNEEGKVNFRVFQDPDYENEILSSLDARIGGKLYRLNI